MNSERPDRDAGRSRAHDGHMRYAQRGGYTPAEQRYRWTVARLGAIFSPRPGDPTRDVAGDHARVGVTVVSPTSR